MQNLFCLLYRQNPQDYCCPSHESSRGYAPVVVPGLFRDLFTIMTQQ